MAGSAVIVFLMIIRFVGEYLMASQAGKRVIFFGGAIMSRFGGDDVIIGSQDDAGVIPSVGGGSVKRIDGKASGASWKLVDWGDPLSSEEESTFNCTMTNYVSFASGETAQMCVYEVASDQFVSGTIMSTGRWYDCDLLPALWNNGILHNETNESLYYVDVGANIGGCLMEMLLSTKAKIIAFEPHPMNVFNIKKTVSQLDKSYQDRLMLFPIGLGSESSNFTIYSASNNMGNSGKSKRVNIYLYFKW